jgi:hypothetical protein
MLGFNIVRGCSLVDVLAVAAAAELVGIMLQQIGCISVCDLIYICRVITTRITSFSILIWMDGWIGSNSQ